MKEPWALCTPGFTLMTSSGYVPKHRNGCVRETLHTFKFSPSLVERFYLKWSRAKQNWVWKGRTFPASPCPHQRVTFLLSNPHWTCGRDTPPSSRRLWGCVHPDSGQIGSDICPLFPTTVALHSLKVRQTLQRWDNPFLTSAGDFLFEFWEFECSESEGWIACILRGWVVESHFNPLERFIEAQAYPTPAPVPWLLTCVINTPDVLRQQLKLTVLSLRLSEITGVCHHARPPVSFCFVF